MTRSAAEGPVELVELRVLSIKAAEAGRLDLVCFC